MKSRAVRFLLGGALIALVMLIAVLPSSTPGQTPASSLASSSFNAIAPDVDQSRERFVPEPGEDESQESANLLAMGDYFYHRLSYPTGQFDSSWYLEAKQQDDRVERGVPAGEVTYNRAATQSPLALNASRFTSLGPAPLQSDGCLSCYDYGHVARPHQRDGHRPGDAQCGLPGLGRRRRLEDHQLLLPPTPPGHPSPTTRC